VHLHEVYRALLKQREQRGAIDFESKETQIICDEQGRIERIVPRTRNEAHRLIEEAMLAANVCAADFIEQGKHASLFRVHEGPTPEKRVTLQNYLRAMGLGLSVSDDPKPAEFQAIARQTADRPDAAQIHTMLLRSMQQAIYTPVNSGHFGLAYPAYTHFTSPIRRYPDLLVHRVIKALLAERRYTLQLPAGVTSALDGKPAGYLRRPAKAAASEGAAQASSRPMAPGKGGSGAGKSGEVWETAGAHCSANERRADEASRDVEAWLKCRFMRDRLGEEYSGTVNAVTSFGLFVVLDELYVEGLIHITELGGEYYRFDELRQELRGERTGVRYAVGTRLRVQVSRVDLDGRRIDFRLVRDDAVATPLQQRAARERGAAAATGAEADLAAVKEADRAARRAARQAGAPAKGKGLGKDSKATKAGATGRNTSAPRGSILPLPGADAAPVEGRGRTRTEPGVSASSPRKSRKSR
jgi:ribonuclease R